MSRKKILIHSLVFSPDGVSTAYIYNDIAIAFRDAGYEVVVLTTTPHYNIIQPAVAAQPMQPCAGGLYYKSDFHGIPVYHVPQKKFKHFIARVAGFVYWHLISFFLGIAQKNLSVILSPSPPLTIGFVSILIARIRRAKVIYNVQEIYPDLLINQGNVRSPFILGVLRKLERFVYDHSDSVVTIDDVFYRTIAGRFKNSSKLVVIPNFVDTDLYAPDATAAQSLDKQLFPESAVLRLMYAGNVGHAQDWEPLISLAEAMRNRPVGFWVIGEGVQKAALATEIQERKLENIHLLPYQPRSQMPAITGYADMHFIFMNPKTDGQGFPSKVYTVMACRKPLLIACGRDTPLYNFLIDKDCAFLVPERDLYERTASLVAIVEKLLAERSILEEFGNNGLRQVQAKFSKKAVLTQYVELGNSLLQ